MEERLPVDEDGDEDEDSPQPGSARLGSHAFIA